MSVAVDAIFQASADVDGPSSASRCRRGRRARRPDHRGDRVARRDCLRRGPAKVARRRLRPASAGARFSILDARVRVTPLADEGSFDASRRTVARIDGPAAAILTGERTALNFLQRLSGVASASRRASELVAGTRARVIDTRKTTPGCASWKNTRCASAARAIIALAWTTVFSSRRTTSEQRVASPPPCTLPSGARRPGRSSRSKSPHSTNSKKPCWRAPR